MLLQAPVAYIYGGFLWCNNEKNSLPSVRLFPWLRRQAR